MNPSLLVPLEGENYRVTLLAGSPSPNEKWKAFLNSWVADFTASSFLINIKTLLSLLLMQFICYISVKLLLPAWPWLALPLQLLFN